MTLYRQSRRPSRTWHVVASEIEDRGLCNAAVRQESTPPRSSLPDWPAMLCPACDRLLYPRTPVFNEGETLLAIHLEELNVPFVRQYRYVPGRLFCADFAIPSHRLLIEVNGGLKAAIGGHSGESGIQRDNERLRMAAMYRFLVMRFTPDEVKCGAAKSWIQQFLETEGEYT